MSRELRGTGITRGTGRGPAQWYHREDLLPDEELADDAETEAQRYEDARDAVEEALREQEQETAESAGDEDAAIFDAHIQFLKDPQLDEKIRDAIENGANAEHAVHSSFEGFIDQFKGMDGRMGERADDLRDVRDRVLRELTGRSGGQLPQDGIVLAETLTPSDTVGMDPDQIDGIVTKRGGVTSHASILARSMGIPAVIGVGDELDTVEEGTELLLDPAADRIIIEPTEEELETAAGHEGPEPVHERVSTTDGREIEVAANIASHTEAERAAEHGADGVGLFRTEFLFIERDQAPTEDEQFEAYSEVLEAFPDDRVVIRTLDIGGDKPVPYIDAPEETNPFLGVRGIRLCLGRAEDVFRTQVRALLRAAAVDGGELCVMFPMVTRIEEVTQARELFEDELDQLEDDGMEAAMPEIGIMVETPAAVFRAADLSEHVDFFSIGTNDLTQYVMAASRGNEELAELNRPLQPAVLSAIARTVNAAGEDVWVGMCGEMAGHPELTGLLVGLGLDELSMGVPAVPQTKHNIRELDAAAAEEEAERLLTATTLSAVDSALHESE